MARDFVQELFNKLFRRSAEADRASVPVISEKLVRSANFEKEFQEWKASPRFRELLERLSISYKRVKEMDVQTPYFHIYSTNQANGFFFDQNLGLEPSEFSFMLDHFKEVSLKEGYSLYTSDRKYIEKSSSVQQIDRHYLKPSINRKMEVPLDQRYGNILLEYVRYNEVPAYLKVMVSLYSDRNYSKALPFGDFIDRIFSPG